MVKTYHFENVVSEHPEFTVSGRNLMCESYIEHGGQIQVFPNSTIQCLEWPIKVQYSLENVGSFPYTVPK